MSISRWFVTFVSLCAMVASSHAQIYRWDNHQLIPGTRDMTVWQGVQLIGFDLSYADLGGQFLLQADLSYSTLTNANLTNATLDDAHERRFCREPW